MAELLVVRFAGNMHRASGVLDELRVLDDKWIFGICDAVAVHRKPDGHVDRDQSYQPTINRGSEWGVILGRFIEATLDHPDGVEATSSEVLTDTPELSEEFSREVRSMVRPGDSAIFVITKTVDSSLVAARFQAYGGVTQQTTIPDMRPTGTLRFLKSPMH